MINDLWHHTKYQKNLRQKLLTYRQTKGETIGTPAESGNAKNHEIPCAMKYYVKRFIKNK